MTKKTTLIIISFLFLAILAYLVVFFWVIPRAHDVTLANFSAPLFEIEEPKKTDLLDSISVVGQQSSSGDHCDYLAAILLSSELPKDELESYYLTNYTGESDVQFVWLNDDNIYTTDTFDFRAIYTLKDWISNKKNNTNASVVVLIFESQMTSSFDYRCS